MTDGVSTGDNERFHAQTDGIIGLVDVTIRVEADQEDEHLASLIHEDLVSRADEINQIVELERHPDATSPKLRIDWEGWLAGDYDTDTDRDGGDGDE